MIILQNFSDIRKEHINFSRYHLIIILAQYNFGKSSYCTTQLFDFFGGKDTVYATFTDQSKPSFEPRKNDLTFGQLVHGKIVIFDELTDDQQRDIHNYAKELLKDNRMIILSNPYGTSSNPEREIMTFQKEEQPLISEYPTQFIYVKEKWTPQS